MSSHIQTSAKKSSPKKRIKTRSCGRSTLHPMLATVASMPLWTKSPSDITGKGSKVT